MYYKAWGGVEMKMRRKDVTGWGHSPSKGPRRGEGEAL